MKENFQNRLSQPTDQYRRIIHIDMDAFYASVEQRDNPALKGKPVAVGGGQRGVVAAASYEARQYGVRSAMPSVIAKRKCPHLIFVKPRFEEYRNVSYQIREIFHDYTDLVEPLSLDEAFLDVTENHKKLYSGTLIAEQIRKRIFETTQLTSSAGVSINKFVAKIASDINKPNGIKVILPHEVVPFLEGLPIEKFFGIGKVTAKKMKDKGIFKGADLKKWTEFDLVRIFGKVGKHYFNMVRGIDHRPVNPNRIRKSIGAERTFSEDLNKLPQMVEKINYIAEKLFKGVAKKENYGKTLTLKIKFADFKVITRSKTFDSYIKDLDVLKRESLKLMEENFVEDMKVRLLGISISNLISEKMIEEGFQLEIPFEDWKDES